MNHRTLLKRSNRTLKKNETVIEALATLTHIHMADSKLTELSELHLFPMCSTLYCYDNEITSLEGIDALPKLEELQAQDNQITAIPQMNNFQLRKLDLRNNNIAKIENLDRQFCMSELYLSRQRVPEVILTPLCFQSISDYLEVLEISDCGLHDLHELYCLRNLRVLNISGNKVETLEQVSELLHNLLYLENIDLRGNPVCNVVKYREQVIIMGAFTELDGKEIPESQRESLIRLAHRKISTKPKAPKPKAKPKQPGLFIQHLG